MLYQDNPQRRGAGGLQFGEKQQQPSRKLVSNNNKSKSHGKFANRIILCLFALSLLWLTSLQLSVTIVDRFIAIPTLQVRVHGMLM